MLWNNWQAIGRIIIIGTLGYVALIVLLRLYGKRSLSQMNIFDFVITVSLGSLYASLVINKNTALFEGVFAFGWLLGLQCLVSWLSMRSKSFQELIKASPTLVYFHDDYIDAALRRERVTEEEVRAAVRRQGHSDLQQVEAVILETAGNFSVIKKSEVEDSGSLLDVKTQIENLSAGTS